MRKGPSGVWGQVVSFQENKNRTDFGFSSQNSSMVKLNTASCSYHEIFHSAGCIHPTSPKVDVIIEDTPELEMSNFMTQGRVVKNWIAMDILECIHVSKYFVFVSFKILSFCPR